MNFEILKVRLEDVPQKPYADGVGKHRGVCLHATANFGSSEKEDTAMNERNWEQGHWGDAFVHYFCDYMMILDVADDDYISYGCSGGNPYYINVELCQTKRADRFIESYNRWIYIAAKVLYDNKLGVIDEKTLVSHKWVSDNYSGSHQDPIEYLAYHGKVWADVVADVTQAYADLENNLEGDEENMAMQLTQYQWECLNRIFGTRYNNKEIDYKWVQKIRDKNLTVSELVYLNSVVAAEKEAISTEPDAYGMTAD